MTTELAEYYKSGTPVNVSREELTDLTMAAA